MKKYFLSEENFRKKPVEPNNADGRTHTNVRLIDEEAELYASPVEGGEYSICSYNIVPTLYGIIDNEITKFSAGTPGFAAPGGFGTFGVPGASVPSGGFGAMESSGYGSSGSGASGSGASAENEGMNMGGGKKHKTRKNEKNRKSKHRKNRKSKHRKQRKSKRR
jgi:hypothetical protein